MKPFSYAGGGVNSHPSFAIPIPDYVNVRRLAANTAEVITVPTGAAIAVLSANTDVWISDDSSPAIPSADSDDVTDGSGSFLLPAASRGRHEFSVNGISKIGVITNDSDGGRVCAAFYSAGRAG